MLVDEASYQISKFWRRMKVKITHADHTQILRTVGILLVAFAVLGTSPQNGRKSAHNQPQNQTPSASVRGKQSTISNQQLIPRLPDGPPMATISAQAAYLIDSQKRTVLFEKNADERLPMASLTKIATAVVVLNEYRLDEIVTVPEACAALPPNEMGLVSNEKISVENLLYGMLVASGSDAACALSHHFDGNFLELMNRKARELGLSQTHFENEVGLDGENGNHLSTAKDLVRLSQAALKNGVFRKIVGTRQVNVSDVSQTRWHNLVSTSELLFTLPGTTGVKTGQTEQAGGCLAVSYERDGREIIGVILGSDDRFGEMQEILNWIFKVYTWD